MKSVISLSRRTWLSLSGAALVAGLFVLALTPVRAGVSGTWKWSFTSQDGREFHSSVDLEQSGSELTGTYHGQRGPARPIEAGKIEGNQMSFKITGERQGRSFTVRYSGKVEGDDIVGSVSIGGGDRSFDWHARRGGSIDPSGTWTWTSRRRNGDAVESRLELKLHGGKLTGVYQGARGGDSEIQDGAVHGDKVSFKVIRRFQDREFQLRFAATVKGDQLTGTIHFHFGDQDREREWTAKRVRRQADPSGDWAFRLTAPDGNVFEASLRLHVEQGQISGRLAGDDWELPVKNGKVDGNRLRFVVEREDDSGRTITYHLKGKLEGKLEGKRMAGTVAFKSAEGEDVSREWSAEQD